ncbi:MAG: methyltransferase [Treponema sp. CETP13]|nr:MAG: methyltransferase [Treponema sp. CETP13]
MAEQNVYDNEEFFNGYTQIRNQESNKNNIFEKPALFSLLPDLKDKTILDLGCGYGENCMEFIRKGSGKVIGIDISKKMLEVARKENSDSRIEYKNMPMEEIGSLKEEFDIVVSSLAMHYVQDYSGLVKNVFRLLNKNGLFIFSQENPLNTCFTTGNRWTRDENDEKIFANISNYGMDGERESKWFINNVKKYHRTFSTTINTLIEKGFEVKKMIEPVPTKEILEKHPEYKDLFHKPDFLLVKAVKKYRTV